MAVTKAQQKAVAKYMKNNYDELKIRVPKGKKNIINEIAAEQGESINGYTKKALKAQIKADTGEYIEL